MRRSPGGVADAVEAPVSSAARFATQFHWMKMPDALLKMSRMVRFLVGGDRVHVVGHAHHWTGDPKLPWRLAPGVR